MHDIQWNIEGILCMTMASCGGIKVEQSPSIHAKPKTFEKGFHISSSHLKSFLVFCWQNLVNCVLFSQKVAAMMLAICNSFTVGLGYYT